MAEQASPVDLDVERTEGLAKKRLRTAPNRTLEIAEYVRAEIKENRSLANIKKVIDDAAVKFEVKPPSIRQACKRAHISLVSDEYKDRHPKSKAQGPRSDEAYVVDAVAFERMVLSLVRGHTAFYTRNAMISKLKDLFQLSSYDEAVQKWRHLSERNSRRG